MTERRPVGRPKNTDPAKKNTRLCCCVPETILDEIEFDMDARGQVNKSQKIVEIIQYWLDNCPDRVVGKIERKKGPGASGSKLDAFRDRYL